MISASLLIFDLDGTLIDSRVDIARSVNLTFRDLGRPEKPPEVIYGYVGNGVRHLIVDAIESDDPAQVSRALSIFENHYLTHLLDETRLYPGIAELLVRLSRTKKSIATNKPIIYTTDILKGLGLSNAFDLVLGGTPDRRLKPDPQMICETLTFFGVSPDAALFIGDSTNDVHAARAAGVRCCGVGYGLSPKEEVRAALPDFFADTVADLDRLLGASERGL
jgi:phosphoglycolate phosphatase